MIELASDRGLHAIAFNKLMVDGGAIVRSADCCEMEIAYAKIEGRFIVFEDGTAVVIRTKEWLDRAEELIVQWA